MRVSSDGIVAAAAASELAIETVHLATGESLERDPTDADSILFVFAGHGICRAQGERRAEPFAAGTQEMRGHVTEESVVDPDRSLEGFLDPAQVFGQRQEAEVVDEPHRPQARTGGEQASTRSG